MDDYGMECRWGGPATDACWDVSACGCRPSMAEMVWTEAHLDHLSHLFREMFDAVTEALRIPQFADWVSRHVA